jgi:hypothetical protein
MFMKPQDTPPALLADLLEGEGRRLPMNAAWAELANTWCKRNEATSKQLADHLGIRPQSCSQWKTGCDDRQPTWGAIVQLCDELNMQIVISADAVQVKRRRKRKT